MMKKIILITIALLFIFSSKAFALSTVEHSATLAKNEVIDNRVQTLRNFLVSHNSPFAHLAYVMVEKADKYGLDWRLLPAISGVESTFGKHIPQGSFNAYGWNGGNYYFGSWENSFEVMAKSLSEKYVKKGLDTPYKISPVYCPPNKLWGQKVAYFMNKIENFDKENVLKITF